MVKTSAFLTLMLAAVLAGPASAASAARASVIRPAAKPPVVTNHIAQLDGPVTALYYVGDRLLILFRTERGVGMVILPTLGTEYQTYGIQDGPDGIDPLGAKEQSPRTDGPTPVN